MGLAFSSDGLAIENFDLSISVANFITGRDGSAKMLLGESC